MDIKNIEQNRDSLIESLIAEEQELVKKIEKARKDDDYGLYKNLIRALTDVTSLKQRELANVPRETWEEKFSHYWEGKELESGKNEYVAIWEQKGNEIRKHRIFKVTEDLSNKPTYDLYFDVERRDDGNCKCRIYFKDKVNGVVGDFKFIAKYISDLCFNENVNIYGDTFGLGLGLADHLKELGYTVKPTIINSTDVTRNIFNKEIKQNYGKLR
jgi:hypothetical protein